MFCLGRLGYVGIVMVSYREWDGLVLHTIPACSLTYEYLSTYLPIVGSCSPVFYHTIQVGWLQAQQYLCNKLHSTIRQCEFRYLVNRQPRLVRGGRGRIQTQ